MVRWFSLSLLLGAIVVVGVFFYRVMVGFFLPLFLAAILVIMFRPVHTWMLARLPGRMRLAAAATTLIIAAIVLLPMIMVVTLAAVEARSIVASLSDKEIKQRLHGLRSTLRLDYEYAAEIRYLESSLATLVAEAKLGATAKGDPTAADRLIDVADQLQQRLVDDGRDVRLMDPLRESLLVMQATMRNPVGIGTLSYQMEVNQAAEELNSFKLLLLKNEFNAWLKELANPTEDQLSLLSDRLFAGAPGFLRSLGGTTTVIAGKTALGLGIMVLAVYFFLADGPSMIATLMRLSPLDDSQERELLDEFDRISRAVVVATLLSAVVQGILAGVGFQLAGVGSVFLLMLATIVCALVPFVGAATVWIPVSLWLYLYDGRPIAAAVLAVYGAGVISMADNVIKPMVLHGQSNLHPLLALLSVLGGVTALGPIGILVGPMIVVFLQTLLNILHRELATLDQSPGPALAGIEPASAGDFPAGP